MAISKIIGSGLGTINSPVEFTSTATIAGNVTATSGLTVAGLPITGEATAGRNIIINGAMNVAQRSASVTGLGAAEGYFTLDRFVFSPTATAGRATMSQVADGPNGISANCLKLDCTTADASIAAGESFNLQQRFEGQNLQRIGKGVVGAKQITVSFYVKASASFTFAIELFDADNTRQITKLFDTTTDWNRIELTFPADVDDGSSPFDDDNANSLFFVLQLHAGSNFTSGTLNTASWANNTNANRYVGIDSFFSNTANNFFLTGVQLEVGPVATEFEQEDFGVTLAKCQRYFHSNVFASGKTCSAGGCVNSSTISVNAGMTHPVLMRASPTASFSDATHFAVRHRNVATVCTALALGADPRSSYWQGTVSSGLTVGDGTFGRSADNACTLSFDAEL